VVLSARGGDCLSAAFCSRKLLWVKSRWVSWFGARGSFSSKFWNTLSGGTVESCSLFEGKRRALFSAVVYDTWMLDRPMALTVDLMGMLWRTLLILEMAELVLAPL